MIIKTDENIQFIELYMLKYNGWSFCGNHAFLDKWTIMCINYKPKLYHDFDIIISGKSLEYIRKYCYDNNIRK